MSRIIKGSLGLVATVLLGSVAQAGTPTHTTCVVPPKPCVSCVGPKTGTSTLPPLSSYFDHQAHCGKVYKPVPKVVHHAPVPSYKHHVPRHRPKHHPKKPCIVVVHKTTTQCKTVIIKNVHRPIVHPPKIHPPIVRPPVIHPPVVHPPVIHPPRPRYVRVVRPIVHVPYPVPVPVTYPVYAPCPTAPCQPVRRYSRYGN